MSTEVMLEGVFGALADGVAVHDPAGRLILACPVATRILGLAQERMKAVAAESPRWHGECADGTIIGGELQALASLRTGRPPRNIALRFEQPLPTGCWVLAHVQPIEHLENPWYSCVISTFVDITARPPLENDRNPCLTRLEDASQKLLLAIEAGQVGAWELDPATLTFRWSEEMFAIYGAPVQDSVPESIWRDRIMPEDLPGIQKKFHHALSGKASGPVGFRVRRGDGMVRQLLMSAVPVFDRARRPACVVGLTLDRTAQFEAEQTARPGQGRPRGATKAVSEIP